MKSVRKIKFAANLGMTSLELIVVICIFAIIASTLLFRYSTFTNSVALENLAQEVALQVKQAQTSAISGAYPKLNQAGTLQGPPDSTWRPTYGVYFDKNTPKQFVFFFDRNSTAIPGNRFLDDAGISITPESCGKQTAAECLSVITISTQEFISDICVGNNCGKSNAAITFSRPFPDSVVEHSINFGNGSFSTATGDLKIKISNPDTQLSTKVITVTPLGQIAISSDAPSSTTSVQQGPTGGTELGSGSGSGTSQEATSPGE